MQTTQFVADLFRKYPLLFCGIVALTLAGALVESAQVLTLAPIADFVMDSSLQHATPLTMRITSYMKEHGITVSLWNLVMLLLLFNILKTILVIIAHYGIIRLNYIMIHDLAVETYQTFFNAQWHFLSAKKMGALLNTLMRELAIVAKAFRSMGGLFAAIANLMILSIIPIYVSWKVTVVSLLTFIFLAMPLLLMGKLAYRLGRQTTAAHGEYGTLLQESFSACKLILGHGNQNQAVRALDKSYFDACQASIKSQTLALIIPKTYAVIGILVAIIGLLVARKLSLPLPETVVLLYALIKIAGPAGDIVSKKNSLSNFFPSYELIKGLQLEAMKMAQQNGFREFKTIDSEINLHGVSFAYPNHDLVIKDINIRIPRGQMVAIVGESGSGKSTIVDLLLGLSEPASGVITIDGTPLKEFDIISYRNCIGYVPQESFLFHKSIRENLLWGAPNSSNNDLRAACDIANATEFIEGFPEGLETIVGDRGVRLSGGQKQRLALARAILRKPVLLMLDEATSSLDSHSERLIQDAVERIAQKSTVVVVAHRLSTIKQADYVYVIDKGRVIEQGTHSNLVKMNGRFSRMVRLQNLGSNEGTTDELPPRSIRGSC